LRSLFRGKSCFMFHNILFSGIWKRKWEGMQNTHW
jgi:hypothetical protein